MVFRGWGVWIHQGLVPSTSKDLRAIRVSQPWVKEHDTHNKTPWETFGDQHQKMRRTAQAIRRIIDAADSHKYAVEVEWEEGALWAQAWQHAWTRNAPKEYEWMNQRLHHCKK